MSGFFRGWRRKTGVATLVLACVFASGWVRGQNTLVRVTGPFWPGKHYFELDPVGYAWTLEEQTDSFPSAKTFYYRESIELLSDPITSHHWKRLAEETSAYHGLFNWRWGGFIIGSQQKFDLRQVRFTTWRIPHWSIVTPLTLISAWLLLRKARIAKPKIDSLTYCCVTA